MIRRGEIYYANLSPVVGSEQGGIRPVLVLQNDLGNRYSPTVIVAAITARAKKSTLPIHIPLHSAGTGLARDSVLLLEQVRTIDKTRLLQKAGELDEATMDRVGYALGISLGMTQPDPGSIPNTRGMDS